MLLLPGEGDLRKATYNQQVDDIYKHLDILRRQADKLTSEMILAPGGHVHEFLVNTDFFDHHHEVWGRTGLQIDVGDGKNVHFAKWKYYFC